ncbi:MAG TPA: hypothetical protein VK594_03820, partial [Streptosporangiaceae bacterium]|nr:hypothetical protein [Streptosporangiaceae bacterium]
PGVVLARRAGDDDVVVAHVGSSVPACSAAMYRAYQSGQFASASPMRFSCQVSSWPVHPDRSTHPPVARADS